VILAGAAGRLIALDLNCDDRRHALTSYRDAFEGRIGQRYDWRNENGGGAGSITPVRQYSSGGVAGRGFRAETAIISQQPTSREGTACRQRDGNWHTQ
jgi:surface antigen